MGTTTGTTGSAHSRYAGLLPIEPSEDFFRPIDLKPEDVPLPDGQPSARKRPRTLARFLIAFCAGVAITLLWQSYGDAARDMLANLYPQLGWIGPRPALTAQNPHPPDVIDAVGQNADKVATTIAAGREPTPRSTDQIVTGQDQMTRNTDQTAISVDQPPAAKASNVTVESQGDAASLQPMARSNIKLTEARLPQTLAEKG